MIVWSFLIVEVTYNTSISNRNSTEFSNNFHFFFRKYCTYLIISVHDLDIFEISTVTSQLNFEGNNSSKLFRTNSNPLHFPLCVSYATSIHEQMMHDDKLTEYIATLG